jgi:hypothetical protein
MSPLATEALEAHVAELRAAVDAQLAETAPPIRTLRRLNEATADAIVARYEEGAGLDTLEAEFRPIPRSTIYYQLRRRGVRMRPSSVPHRHPAPEPRTCAREGCDTAFTPTGYQVAQGEGRFCSRACARGASRVAEPEERTCARKGCGNKFTPMPSEAVRPNHGRFCSYRCRGLESWRTGNVAGFVQSLTERGLFKLRAQRRWGGRWGGHKAPGPGARPRGKPRGYSEKQVRIIQLLRERDPKIGRARAARLSGTTEKQARVILDQLAKG